MSAGPAQEELDPTASPGSSAPGPREGAARPWASRSPRERVPVVVLAVVLAAVVLAAVPPGNELVRIPVGIQLVALRGLVAAAATALAGLAGLVWFLGRRRGRTSPGAAVFAVGLVALALTDVAVLGVRGTAGLMGAEPAAVRPREGQLVVLAFNTQGDVRSADLAAFVEARHADLVMLPETSAGTARATVARLSERGLHYQLLVETLTGGSNPTTALLVGERVGGTYAVTERGPAASFAAASPHGPPLTAVHTHAPVDLDPAWWAGSVRWAARSCGERPGAIVAGDFNATLDHAPLELGGCVDAAVTAGAGGVGTWPTVVPRALGAAIDHVLVDPDVWRVVRARVLDGPAGSDHRPLEAVVERR